MPRIRTIKPEFCTSDQVADCSTTARLLFVLMWLFCDDAGRHPDNAKRLKMECFPGDAITTDQIESLLQELIAAGLLIRYQHSGSRFLQVTGWKKHQKIEKASYKYPPLDARGCPTEIEISTTIRRPFDDYSSTVNPRKGMEGNGKEGSHICAVVDKSTTAPEEPSGFLFVLTGGTDWSLPKSKLDEFAKTFPDLDLEREMRVAAQWLRDNPRRRKTARGMNGFLSSWLTRSQEKGTYTKRGELDFGESRVASINELEDYRP